MSRSARPLLRALPLIALGACTYGLPAGEPLPDPEPPSERPGPYAVGQVR